MTQWDGGREHREAKGSKQSVRNENGGEGSSFESELQQAMVAFRKGDFAVRLPTNWTGVQGRIADLFNEVVEMSARRAQQAAEVARIELIYWRA